MSGRGRGMTLPAWMAKGGVGDAAGGPGTSVTLGNGASAAIPINRPLIVGVSNQKSVAHSSTIDANVQSVSVAATTSSSIASNNGQTVWQEHRAPDGRVFYYNPSTNTSTYQKPDCLKTEMERRVPVCEWQEYSASDGSRKYYSNGKESKWEMPAEYKAWKELMSKAVRGDLADGDVVVHVASSVPVKPSSSSIVTTQVQSLTRQEVQDRFFALLKSKSISSTSKWREVEVACSSCSDWSVTGSNGDRRQMLSEYQSKMIKVEADEQLNMSKKKKNQFLLMLAECSLVNYASSLDTVRLACGRDERFRQVEDEVAVKLTVDFLSELQRKHQLETTCARNLALDEFKKLLTDKYDMIMVWDDVRDEVLSLGSGTSTSSSVVLLDDAAKRSVFNSTMNDVQVRLDRSNKLRLMNEKLLLKEEEEVVRRAMMANLNDGLPALNGIVVTSQIALGELAGEVNDGVKGKLKSAVRFINSLGVDYGVHVTVVEGVLDQVAATLTSSNTSISTDMMDRIKSRITGFSCISRIIDRHYRDIRTAKEDVRIARERKFEDLLTQFFYRSDHVNCTYEDAVQLAGNKAAFLELSDEERRSVFAIYMKDLNRKLQDVLMARVSGDDDVTGRKRKREDASESK